MPRRRVTAKRSITPDPKFGSRLVAKFINCVMRCGKKSVAERIVYDALDVLEKNGAALGETASNAPHLIDGTDEQALLSSLSVRVLLRALSSVAPSVEVRPRRVGGATYQIPIEVRASRRLALAMRWVIDSAKQRSEKKMSRRLAQELLDAANGRGSAVKKRETVHAMAKANQAFAHLR